MARESDNGVYTIVFLVMEKMFMSRNPIQTYYRGVLNRYSKTQKMIGTSCLIHNRSYPQQNTLFKHYCNKYDKAEGHRFGDI